MVEKRVMFPAGVGPGVIIGKGGSNIKNLASRSMARFAVKDDHVIVSGTASAVDAGEAMLLLQFKSHKSAGGAYPHPLEVQYILSSDFGDPVAAEFRARQDDETVRASHRREQMHHLCPSQRTSAYRQSAALYADVSSLTSMMAGASLGRSVNANGKADGTFHGHESVQMVTTSLAAATVTAMTTLPRMDVLKLRFNFGKALFYNDRHTERLLPVNSPQTLSQLKGFKIGQDLKSVFSNGATAGQVRLVTAWLQRQGFTRGQDKHTVSLHVVDVNANASYNIAMDLNQPGDILSVRKLKTASTKVCFVTSIRPPDQLDARFKILGHYTTQLSPALEAKLRKVARLCRFDRASNSLDSPELEPMGLALNHCRIKRKQVFHGRVQQRGPPSIDVKISVVTCATEQGTHTEIQGMSEPLNDLLLQLHAAGNNSARAAKEVQAVVPSILAWCDTLAQAMV